MTELLAVFAVLAMACAIWLISGLLLLPPRCPVRTVITADGCGEGLEQTVRGLLWLRRAGLLRGDIAIQDGGLDHTGVELALTLARKNQLDFWGRTSEYIKKA